MKKNLVIPKTFELGGRTWTVDMAEQSTMLEGASFGIEIYDLAKIHLYKKHSGFDVPRERIERTYLHEVLHAALDETQYKDLSNDEVFVSRIANALHQIFVTSEGQAK